MATEARPLDPYPDSLYGADAGPLALIAAMQRLPARERAVIGLADVAGFSPAEVAEMLEVDPGWVARTAARARAALDAATPLTGGAGPPSPGSARERLVVLRLLAALEAVDPEAVGALLSDEVTLTCTRRWAVFRGPPRVAAILCERMTDERLRLLPTRANGQPAFGCYGEGADGAAARPRGLLAITLADDRVATLIRFWDNAVLAYFGLPELLPAGA